MKIFWKNSLLLLLFFIFFLFKDAIYGLFYVKENDFTYIKENELNYYKTEYENLLKAYDLDYIKENHYILSKVIYRDIYDFYNEILIYKGKDKDLKVGDAVFSKEGFIGVIDKVHEHSSYVKLLYNKDLKVSVKINDTYGILESKNNKLYVKNLVSQANINPGDMVYTSGLTNIPKDIPIGKVSKINVSKDKLSLFVEIKEIANLKDMDYVLILSSKDSDSKL